MRVPVELTVVETEAVALLLRVPLLLAELDTLGVPVTLELCVGVIVTVPDIEAVTVSEAAEGTRETKEFTSMQHGIATI